MKSMYLVAACAAALAATAVAATIPPNIEAAVANSARPQADRDRDAARKPAEVLAFAGVKPGEQVLELIPGGGYFTRVLSGAVGPSGHVTEAVPLVGGADMSKASNGVAADPHFSNVSETPLGPDTFVKALSQYDLVWTSQNYHDLHDPFMGSPDLAHLNKAIFDALKPGGLYIVLDHAAEAGSGLRDTDTLHRIDPATVKKEVEAAGLDRKSVV